MNVCERKPKEKNNKIVPLNDGTIKLPRQKHPRSIEAPDKFLLPNKFEIEHFVKWKSILVGLVRNLVFKTRGSFGPSRMDAD